MNAADQRERELLLLVARPAATPLEIRRTKELASTALRWDVVEAGAAFHLLEPALWRHIGALESVPADVRKRLRNAWITATARNLQLTAVACRLQSLFASAGIPLLTIKGPILALEAYGDLAQRWFSDVDVLVKRADAARAITLLEGQGMRPVFPFQGDWRDRYLHRFYELTLCDPQGVSIDLHWTLIDPQFSFCPAEGAAWHGTREVSVHGKVLHTLSTEMTAKYLCLHVSKHHWDRLGWLSDVAHWSAAHPAVDWSILAADPQVGRFVLVTLGLIERLLVRPLPPGVAALIDNDPIAKKQVAAVDARLLRTGRYEITRSAHWRTEFACAMPNSADRWRSFYSTLFRPSVLEWMAVPLPKVLSPLYAVIRPCRLLWKRLRPSSGPAAGHPAAAVTSCDEL